MKSATVAAILCWVMAFINLFFAIRTTNRYKKSIEYLKTSKKLSEELLDAQKDLICNSVCKFKDNSESQEELDVLCDICPLNLLKDKAI